MSLRAPTDDENAGGKIPRVPLGMTVSVISNPFDALRVNSVRDLSLILFLKEWFMSSRSPLKDENGISLGCSEF